ATPHDLHSFPTRRSSDLDRDAEAGEDHEAGGVLGHSAEKSADQATDRGADSTQEPALSRPFERDVEPRAGFDRLDRRVRVAVPRSEEHTSELQSRENLVC